ncbi:MAG: alpha/beta hydrolase, partial [Chloroflexi bacterium]|nr:alpha/beta hydrolase [Chloroflexota bacterium]
MPDEYTLRHVTVAPGVTLAFDEWPAHGPRVVFLHATGFSRGCWRPLARRIAGRAQPTLVDMRGHGASSRPPAPYLWPSLVDDIAELITAQDWSGIVLGGHSVGGSTAIQVAARLPERVAALVLVEPVITGARKLPAPAAAAP